MLALLAAVAVPEAVLGLACLGAPPARFCPRDHARLKVPATRPTQPRTLAARTSENSYGLREQGMKDNRSPRVRDSDCTRFTGMCRLPLRPCCPSRSSRTFSRRRSGRLRSRRRAQAARARGLSRRRRPPRAPGRAGKASSLLGLLRHPLEGVVGEEGVVGIRKRTSGQSRGCANS
jgi:hypothetical protein